MGHTRLGLIPKSNKWVAVVSMFAETATADQVYFSPSDVEIIAEKTMKAAQGGIEKAIKDYGLIFCFYLLTQIALSARYRDWQQRLGALGIHVSPDATVFDLTTEAQSCIDLFVLKRSQRTDISEMAQQAVGETLTAMTTQRSLPIFKGDMGGLQIPLHEVSTRNGFAELGRSFFGSFMYRFLNFYLSRVTATNLGVNKIQCIGTISEFNKTLRQHCYQSALIVRDFCGEWFSKTEYQEGISFENTSGFIAVALKKLQAELQQQKSGQ
jgi:hypothetical protein